jgi:hypothetical protein
MASPVPRLKTEAAIKRGIPYISTWSQFDGLSCPKRLKTEAAIKRGIPNILHGASLMASHIPRDSKQRPQERKEYLIFLQ